MNNGKHIEDIARTAALQAESALNQARSLETSLSKLADDFSKHKSFVEGELKLANHKLDAISSRLAEQDKSSQEMQGHIHSLRTKVASYGFAVILGSIVVRLLERILP